MTTEIPPEMAEEEPQRRTSRKLVPEHARDTKGAIHRLVGASLKEPLLVALLALAVIGIGVWSFLRLPVDAYPDVSPPRVEITTAWPGHAAEEVERLTGRLEPTRRIDLRRPARLPGGFC